MNIVEKAISDLSYSLSRSIGYRIISSDSTIAYYKKGFMFLNEDKIDINDYQQVISIAAHEIGHNLFSPVFTEVGIVEFVIVQSVMYELNGVGSRVVVLLNSNGIPVPVKDLTNLIDDQIVNASVVKFMTKKLKNPYKPSWDTVSDTFKEWIANGAEIKTGKVYDYSAFSSMPDEFKIHLRIMQDIVAGKPLPAPLQKLVDKGMGMNKIQEYYKNYYDYAKYYIKKILDMGGKLEVL